MSEANTYIFDCLEFVDRYECVGCGLGQSKRKIHLTLLDISSRSFIWIRIFFLEKSYPMG